jgi:hypothetical protein
VSALSETVIRKMKNATLSKIKKVKVKSKSNDDRGHEIDSRE